MYYDEQKLAIESNQFGKLREDTNKILQKLTEKMIRKESDEGEITIKINLKFVPEYVDAGPGNTARRALKPKIDHKVSSVLKVTDEEKGNFYDEEKEIVYDEERKEYVTRYIQGAEQMNLFEGEMGEKICPKPEEASDPEEPAQQKALEGPTVAQIEDKYTASESDENVIDAEYYEIDENTEDSGKDDYTGNDESGEPDNEQPSQDPEEFLSDYQDFENYQYDDPEE